jgi:hypothetical protein
VLRILSDPQLIGLISGVITGVTAGAMGFMGAAALIAGLRFADFLLAGLFFFAALRAGFLLPAFFLLDFFLATRFFDERFLDDFFFAFFADFFFAFFFAAMVDPFNVDRLSGAAGPTGPAAHYQRSHSNTGERILCTAPTVKGDYLIRLDPFWYRVDTNRARSTRF